MKIFKTLIGAWLVFVGLMVSNLIPAIPVNWEVAGGTFMVVVGVTVVNDSLDRKRGD